MLAGTVVTAVYQTLAQACLKTLKYIHISLSSNLNEIVRDHLHALPHISDGYFTDLRVIGPMFGWQSDAFDVSRAKIYNRCDVEPFFGEVIMKCLLYDHALMLIKFGSIHIGPPQCTSSPTTKQNKCPVNKKSLRLLNINFQSMKAKREEFWSMLEYTDPDNIIASETWLLWIESFIDVDVSFKFDDKLYVCISKSSNKLVLKFGRPQL
jgi:hypothetical protein